MMIPPVSVGWYLDKVNEEFVVLSDTQRLMVCFVLCAPKCRASW